MWEIKGHGWGWGALSRKGGSWAYLTDDKGIMEGSD